MPIQMPLSSTEPPHDCPLCPRLVALREEIAAEHPDWWNAPVPAWGDPKAWLALIGLAPGKHGAHRTGRPFTGDYAGDLLFETLLDHGLAQGSYDAHVDDRLRLTGAIIINAVKCLPPQNKPNKQETDNCRQFLTAQMGKLKHVKVYVALGRVAHDSFLKARGLRLSHHPFGHGAEHPLIDGSWLIDSYHCSRYNTQTGRLTPDMFSRVFDRAKQVAAV